MSSLPLVAWMSRDTASAESADEAGFWTEHDRLCIPVDDLGFRQAATAVERLRTYGGRPAAVGRHAVRLRRTLECLGLSVAADEVRIRRRIEMLIERNRQWCEDQGDFGITMIVTPGVEIMHLNPLDHAGIAHARTEGKPLIVTEVEQPSAKAWPRDIKVRCRLHYYLADRIAREIDPEALGVVVDADGSVTETSTAAVGAIIDGQWVSPPADQVLPSVSEAIVEEVVERLGIDRTRRTLFPAELREADEVWLMGTDTGLFFANRVDGHRIGDGRPGPVFQTVLPHFDARIRESADG